MPAKTNMPILLMKTNEVLKRPGPLPSPPDAAWKTQLSRQPAAEPLDLLPPDWPLARLFQTLTACLRRRGATGAAFIYTERVSFLRNAAV